MYDVVIIGYGPTGMLDAALMMHQRRGVRRAGTVLNNTWTPIAPLGRAVRRFPYTSPGRPSLSANARYGNTSLPEVR
jgi:hypothetical protein